MKRVVLSLLGAIALASPSWAATPLPASLEAKLVRIAEARARARQEAANRMAEGQAPLDRAAWEELLGTGKPATTLTAQELQRLKTFHRALIRESKEQAERESVLYMENIRAAGGDVAERFCRELPKGGMLHLHPWGTLRRPTVERILGAVNPEIDLGKLRSSLYAEDQPGSLYPGELDFLVPYGNKVPYADLSAADKGKVHGLFFLPQGTHGFKRFMGVFTFMSAMVFANRDVDPEPMMWDAFLYDSAALGVRYVEVTTNVRNAAWARGLEEWASQMQTRHGVTVRLLAAFNRMLGADRNRDQAKKLLELPASPILVGANMQADETDHPALEKGQTVYSTILAARNQGRTNLRLTMHAGELGDPRNPRDAMILGAERLGHAVKLGADPLSLELARRSGQAVEANLESNLRLKVVGGMNKHPFLDQLRLGLKVSLSTDDEGMFESDIHDECLHAVNGTDVTYAELKKMSRLSIETSFADEATRGRLLHDLEEDFRAFEARWDAVDL